MAIRFGCSSGAFFPHIATEEVPALAASLGMFDIELMLQAHEEYERSFFDDVRNRAEAHGVSIRSVHLMQPFHPLFSPYKRRAAEAWRLFEKGIEGAARAGAEMIVWHGPCQGEVQEHDALDRLLTAAKELARQCAAAGLTLTIENVSWCYLSSVRAVRALASRIDEIVPFPTVGFTFDAFQAAESGANPFMMLAAMDGRLANVHLRDFREDDRSQRTLPPGDGDLPWPALMRAIAGTGFDGPLMIEGALGPDPEATMARIRARLEPIIEGLGVTSNPCEGELPAGVLEGIRLFNEGAYYECHEEIEHEWHAERGPVRALYQGILQIGVGFHHSRNGNHRGAILLLTDGIEKTSRFLPACRGIDTERLVRESQRCLDQIIDLGPERLSAFDWSLVPQVHFLEVPASVANNPS